MLPVQPDLCTRENCQYMQWYLRLYIIVRTDKLPVQNGSEGERQLSSFKKDDKDNANSDKP